MSSDDSRTSSSSRLSQFGIYRSIDAKTEEFLRLSRKRQIRQGCACAAVSTAITVTIVIVILLIYEYAIAVESSIVQRIRNISHTNETNDSPKAARLDRNYLGFDQNYYEQMPLLVNALQENSPMDPTADAIISVKSNARYRLANHSQPTISTFTYRTNGIRRTSPRPFYFEYKSPTPTPFSKTYGSKSWIDNYRNAQRLKNLQQVIHYLEKTINAKFGDLYALPTSTIAFSGIYVEPVITDESQTKPTTSSMDLMSQASNVVEKYKSNHKSIDPLYSYKPDNPGDVNLLADGFFRFSPVATLGLLRDKLPMFRPIAHRKRNCRGVRCYQTAESNIVNSQAENDLKHIATTSHDKPKTFSVMLNLFPLKPKDMEYKGIETLETTQVPINNIYLTTSRPAVQFRRKSTTPIRRIITRFKKPLLPTRKLFKAVDLLSEENNKPKVIEPKMIVHVNVYPSAEIKDQITTESNIYTTITNPPKYTTQIPMLTSTQVEDFHVGSSGIISPETRLTPAPPLIKIHVPTLPTPTTIIPFFDTSSTSIEPNFNLTNPPEILKFGHEDARIPKHYNNIILKSVSTNQPNMNRRNSKDNDETNEDYEEESSTLANKLKISYIETTTKQVPTEKNKEVENMPYTIKTYVPQINGHYRSLNQNSKNINTWINDSTESSRKKRLEISVAGFRKSTYVPYVEIKRNITRNHSDKDEKQE